MPKIERNDIWNQWKTGTQQYAYIKLLVCPSDPPDVVNAGPSTAPWPTCNGYIFQDGQGLSQDFITSHDGTSMTLMLSENVRTDYVSQRQQCAQLVGRPRLAYLHQHPPTSAQTNLTSLAATGTLPNTLPIWRFSASDADPSSGIDFLPLHCLY